MRRRLRWLAIGLAFVGGAAIAALIVGSVELMFGICGVLTIVLLVWAAAMVLEVLPPPKEEVKVRGAGVSYRPKIDSSEEWLARRLDFSRAERAFFMAVPSLVVTMVYAVVHGAF